MHGMFSARMSGSERRAAASLAAVYAVRMLGLFMILPVFVLYAEHIPDATPLLVGLAIGAYGLTQALLQIPLGMLSDSVGRKPVIVGGLLLFALGSALAALADSIYGVILGRGLQGAGAIAAAVMALAADLTREEHRTKVMAVIGLSIGLSFSLALIAGPVLHDLLGVPGIFWLTALLALLAIAIVLGVVPSPVTRRLQRDAQVVRTAIKQVVRDGQLLRLDLGVAVLHMVLTANFVVIPTLLRDVAGLAAAKHWMLYLPVLLVSFVLMLPFLILGERRRRMKTVLLGAIALLAIAELSLTAGTSVVTISASVLVFFTAFNLLEASLPSLVTKLTAPDLKGTSMGVFSSSQFLGAFFGGVIGGGLLGAGGPKAVFIGAGVAILVWLLVSSTMQNPRHLSSYLLKVGTLSKERAKRVVDQLTQVQGVAEVVVVPEDGMAYLKVDRKVLDETQLREFSAPAA